MRTEYDTWTDEDKRVRDALDRQVAQLYLVDENGHVAARENLTDREIEMIDRWLTRQRDPAFTRMRNVSYQIAARRRPKKHWWRMEEPPKEITVSVSIEMIVLFILIATVNGFPTHIGLTDLLVVWVIYLLIKNRIEMKNEIKQTDEIRDKLEIFREWEIHEKLNHIRGMVFEIEKGQKPG